jgi:hypothetical protein
MKHTVHRKGMTSNTSRIAASWHACYSRDGDVAQREREAADRLREYQRAVSALRSAWTTETGELRQAAKTPAKR